ncbi:TPA: hypothetical protein DDW35_11285 [Candidatus Sumerlaeota bacterium]|nr:hypothetical protein [Candidatus Sumerlaeota bacterium]
MTGLLLESDLGHEQREYAEVVKSSGEALLLLINDILDFSKIEAGKLDLEDIEFDLRTGLDEVLELMSIRAAEKNLELISFIQSGIPSYLRGDPGRLRQILINLINNAIKFTEQGEVVVRVAIDSETTDSCMLRFSVTDSGIGIPADRISRLFQSFSQLDASTTRKFGGTGLGLAISKQLAGLMGGEIGVESQEGKGSSFWFTIQLGKTARNEEQGLSHTPVSIKGIRVLVVSSNPVSREILRLRLFARECVPSDAATAEEAIRMLCEAQKAGTPFHVALLDVQHSGFDTLELAAAIKGSELIRNTPLVQLATVGRRGDAARALETGFDGYLVKPIKHGQMSACLQEIMGRTKGVAVESVPPLITQHSLKETRLRKARILLAEDNLINQKVAVHSLERMGHNIDCAANGRQAVDALNTRAYDIILMDCQMPEMDGYEATVAIRKLQGSKQHTPIIAMTANAIQGDREKCIAAGMDDYISKPFKPDELSTIIQKYLPVVISDMPKDTPQKPAASPVKAALVHDRAALMERVDEDEDLCNELIEIYLTEAPLQIAEIKESHAAQDLPRLIRVAHTLKGASAHISAPVVMALAKEIEFAARDADFDKAAAAFPKLEAAYNEVETALRMPT